MNIFFNEHVLTYFILLHQQTGKSSYIQNIPIPKYEILHGFLYVSFPSLLAYVLALSLPITNLKDVDYDNEETSHTELSASDKAKKIFMDSKRHNGVYYDLVTYITEWSDCFDPNTSSKNNRASVYIKSITFPRKKGSTFPTASYTFPICIGPGKANKLFLEDMFASEIELFKKEDPLKFWDNSTRTFRSIYVDILCSMQDQPERRSGLCLMMGNSRMFSRFGYSCNYQSFTVFKDHVNGAMKRLKMQFLKKDNVKVV